MPVRTFACVHVRIFMHLYKITLFGQNTSKGRIDGISSFCSWGGQDFFFPHTSAPLILKQSLSKCVVPPKLGLHPTFLLWGLQALTVRAYLYKYDLYFPLPPIGKERGEFGPAFIVRVLLINYSQQLTLKKQDTLRAWMESQDEQENVSVTLQLCLINNRILTLGIWYYFAMSVYIICHLLSWCLQGLKR